MLSVKLLEWVMARGKGRHGDQKNKQEASISSNTLSEMTVKKGGGKKYKVPLYMLFSFADATDMFLMTLGSIGALAHGATTPLMTVLLGKTIQSFGGAQDPQDVLHRVSKVAIQYACLAVGAGISSFLQVTCWISTGERQVARMRSLYLKAILKQEIAFFDKEITTGEVVERVSGDTVIIHDAMGEKVGKFIQIMTASTGCIIVAFVKGWLLSFMMMSIIPVGMICGGLVSVFVSKMASKAQKAYSEAAVVVEQAIGSIKTVASFTGEKQSVKEYDIALIKAYKSSIYEGITTGLGLGILTFLMFGGYSLGIWLGGHLILDKDKGYTGAKVINVIFSVLMGGSFLGQVSPCTTAFAAGQAAAYKMFEAINRKPKIDAFDTKARVLPDIKGDIDFKNVYFRYPSREEQIFRGFSVSIKQGTTTALVGESGSGKSTVISLIERFYDPQAGDVLIDGIKINELQLRWLRSKIGLVSQEPILFASSIRDNIAYGKDNATIEEIQLATDSANASRFIDNMPQGLDTMVGAFGTQLSGGQRQRIAIARAILKDPRILLLDEATSALDAESERTVQEALDRIMKKRTTIVVAHRLSTVRNADIIAVLRHGSIVEQGSHIELAKDPNGAYSQLIRLQEMNRTSDSMSHKGSPLADSPIRSNQEISCKLSISREFSSEILSTPHPDSLELGSHVRVDSKGNALEEPRSSSAELPKEVPLTRLASLNKPEIPILLLGTVSAIIHGLVFPVFGVLLSKVIHALYQPPDLVEKDSKFWSLMFLIFGFVSLIALPSRSFYFAVAGSRLIRRIRLMTFQKVVDMEMAWFDDPENSSGAVGARLSTDAATVRNLVGDALGLNVHNITNLIAGLAIAFVSNLKLFLIMLAMLPILYLNGWIQTKSMKGFSCDAKKMYEQASQVANDAVSSIRTVASFSAEEKVVELYQKKCEGPVRKGIKQGVISGIGFGVSLSLLYCAYATIFYAGAHLVQSGETTFGKVFQVFFALTMATKRISESNSALPNSGKAKSATASVFAILDRISKIDPSDVSGMTLENLKGEIKFRHVSFKYPSRPEVQIFHDLCLSIKSGTTVALVGESGSGKSTAIALLQRFYDPDSGNILLDGIELQKFNLKWLRQQMSWVSQEPALFNDTIRANIAFGIEGNATETEIVAAAKAANAHKFISCLQQNDFPSKKY